MADLSVVIIAQDEERTIGAVLKAVNKIAKEIILVDSGSTDKTIEIAQSYGTICHHKPWQGYAAQKNFALSLATSSWILSLDADEVITADLANEIERTFRQPKDQQFNGYLIPRILYIGKTAITHGGFYPDAQLRLFKTGKAEFKPRLVHESATVQGRIGHLKNPIRHYSYVDFADYEKALDKYARLSAQEFAKSSDLTWRTSKLNEWLHPWWTFFYRYVLRGGFFDGAAGLKANWLYQNYVRKKITYLRQLVDSGSQP